MSHPRFEVPLPDSPDYRADAVLGSTVFEVKKDIRDVRMLRALFLEMAHLLAAKPDRRAIIVLHQPQITAARLQTEWKRLQGVISPKVLARMSLVLYQKAGDLRLHGTLTGAERKHLPAIVNHAQGHPPTTIPRPAPAIYDVLRVLLIHWFRRSGSQTSKDIAAQAGCSYPTLAAALATLQPHLTRHSDRRVELKSFPPEAWLQLTSQAEKIRATRRYGDASGRPRPVPVLMERLRELGREDIAVGGVTGARHYLPGLDLMGAPRLDLVVQAGERNTEDDFLRSMDPALKPVDRNQPAHVVIHRIFRPVTFFQKLENGLPCADEVECLLDLEHAGLKSQAHEFRQHLILESIDLA